MKNKLLAVGLFVCLAAGLIGCGAQPAESLGESTETGSGESNTEEVSEPVAEAVIREADYTDIKTAANDTRVSVHE